MAKDNEKPEAEGAAPAKKGSKKTMILAMGLFFIIVLLVAAVVFLMSKGGEEEEGDEEEIAAEQEKQKRKEKKKDDKPPVFVALDPFTVNLQPSDDPMAGDQYLQIVMSLELDDFSSELELKNQLPRIKNDITIFLSSKNAEELKSSDGKARLADDIRDKINVVLNPPVKNRKGQLIPPDGPVLAVLFTSFIVQ